MKSPIFIVLLLINFSCKSQHHKTEKMNTGKDKTAKILKEKDSIMMKNGILDISSLKEKGVSSTSSIPTEDGWESATTYEYNDRLNNGLTLELSGNELSGYSKITGMENNQFRIYSEYYPSGITKQIGELYSNEFAKGIWYWFSESGEIEKYEDYDAPYEFSWEDVQSFLDTHKVRKEDINQIGRTVEPNGPVWYISFKTPELQNTDNVEQYILNGTTGKVLKKELLDISRELD